MSEVVVGKGKIFGKAVFAKRNFKKDEIVIQYHLTSLSEQEYKKLSKEEKNFVHHHWSTRYLYSSPERFVNHSPHPNTRQDLKRQCDIALRKIKKGEEITTDAKKDDFPQKCTTRI